MKQNEIFISLGDLSADRYAATLIENLKTKSDSLLFSGIGGTNSEAAGLTLLSNTVSKSTIGFIEPLMQIPYFYGLFLKCKNYLKVNRPKLVLAIDYQGFNVPLLRYAKSIGLKTAYFIPPQEWQWGSRKGGQTVWECCDKIYGIFKQEADFYNQFGKKAIFIGHPLNDFCNINDHNQQETIAIFPGVRKQEVVHIFPTLLETAKLVQMNNTDFKIKVSTFHNPHIALIKKIVAKLDVNVDYIASDPYPLIQESSVSLTKSGTITLEHFLLARKAYVVYKFSRISYFFLLLFFKSRFKRVNYLSLPNILMKKEIFPEFLQNNAKPHKIAELISKDLNKKQDVIDRDSIIEQLGDKGVFNRLATLLMEQLNE